MNISLMKKLIELSQKNAFQKNIIMQISVRFQYSQINKALAHKRYIFLDMYYCIVYTIHAQLYIHRCINIRVSVNLNRLGVTGLIYTNQLLTLNFLTLFFTTENVDNISVQLFIFYIYLLNWQWYFCNHFIGINNLLFWKV